MVHCHTTLGLRTHLVQTRAARFGPAGQPKLLQLGIGQSAAPVSAIIRGQQVAGCARASRPHAGLEAHCQQGRFRWNLYYRLAVAELELPPPRGYPVAERAQLLDFLVVAKQRSLRRLAPLVLAPEARQRILAYPFPGNVRELENLVETLCVHGEPGQPVR